MGTAWEDRKRPNKFGQSVLEVDQDVDEKCSVTVEVATSGVVVAEKTVVAAKFRHGGSGETHGIGENEDGGVGKGGLSGPAVM